MVEADRTVVIPLTLSEESKSDFHRTTLPYVYCQQETVEYCWPDTPKHPADLQPSKQETERALYNRLWEDTNEHQPDEPHVFVRAGQESTGLNVGDTHPSGEYTKTNWVSTDKPYPHQASESSDSERIRVG